MEIRKIVVGVDFSPDSESAIGEAMRVARHTGAEVVLVHAGPVVEHAEGNGGTYGKEYRRYIDAAFAECRDELESIRQRHVGQGVELSHVLHDGTPATALCSTAEELEADLLVVGSRGRTGVERFLLGSVAEQVLRKSGISVMVARPNESTTNGFEKILAPLNFDDLSNPVVDTAVSVAADRGDVELLHCWHLPYMLVDDWGGGGSSIVDEVRQAMLERSSRQLEQLIQAHRKEGVYIHFERVESGARSGISKRVNEGDYDLVVVGGHKKRPLHERFIGSVAQSTVRHAPCSVIVVKGS